VDPVLFTLPSDAYKITTDDCYTPKWVFDAMGLHFDLDVASPPGGPWHVPATRYYTAQDDGLLQPWDGLVWCNPPYSDYTPWADRFAIHDRAVILGIVLPETLWLPVVFGAADAVAFILCDFVRPDGSKIRLRQKVFVAFRGVGHEPAERLAAADPYGAILYTKGAPAMAEPRLTTRRFGKGGHAYYLDGDKIDGTTSILNALPKQLTQWSSDCAANFAVEHWDELTEQPLTKRLDQIRYAHKDTVSAAALRGQDIHRYGEALVTGEPVQIPEEYLGPTQAYARFLDRWDIHLEAVEAAIVNTVHRYGGRLDLVATIGVRDNVRAMIDLKTGKNIYESVVLQLAAYNHADLWQPDGPGSEQPYKPVDALYVAHILPDDVRMLPVEMRDQDFRQFLYVQQTAHWLDAHGFRGDYPLVGDAARPESDDLLVM
jgi:DNA N-6-adenine-methyltransferase (Dam)